MPPAQDPLSIVQELDAACNAHDLEAVMALFADDAVVRHTPPPDGVGVYRGKAKIRGWMEPQLPGFHVVTHDHRTTGDTIRWSATLTDDLLRQIGQDQPVDAQLEAVVRDGKIASFSVTNPSLIAST
jgi:ketosteroid isomerase-like protein